MKTIGALLFLSVLLPVASIVTLGQSRHLSASESKSYIKLAKEKLSRVPHRERASVLNYSEIGSQPVEISTYTIDYKRLNLFRSVLLSRNGNQTIREELIRDGDNQYLRIGNEKWKKVSPGESAGAGSGVGIGAGVSDEIAVDCEFVGKETVNQVFSARYKRVTTARRASDSFVDVKTENFWFDDKGRLIRCITENTSDRTPTVLVVDTQYEYDVKIDIKAPAVNDL